MYINHITLTTGHLVRSERAGVADQTLEAVSPWLRAAIDAGRPVPLPVHELAHFSARAMMSEGGLVVTIYGPAGPYQAGKPHAGEHIPLVTMAAAQRSRHGAPLWHQMVAAFGAKTGLLRPAEPWCAVALHPSIAGYPDAAHWLGDFERCIAWAWITRNPDLQATQ